MKKVSLEVNGKKVTNEKKSQNKILTYITIAILASALIYLAI